MSDERDLILKRVKDALAPLAKREPLPEYAGDLAVMRQIVAGRDPLELFAERIQIVNARCITDAGKLAAELREKGWVHGYCDPALWPALAPHLGAGFTVETAYDRTRIDDYSFGITRAAGGVAETGTIILSDASTSSRLAALTPWVHIAVLSRATIFSDLSQAVAALGKDPNIIWCTGSSSTADVEGILIRGVHGPGVQIALVLD
jgi:L-lactate dehydrogenase complex protein LldG